MHCHEHQHIFSLYTYLCDQPIAEPENDNLTQFDERKYLFVDKLVSSISRIIHVYFFKFMLNTRRFKSTSSNDYPAIGAYFIICYKT